MHTDFKQKVHFFCKNSEKSPFLDYFFKIAKKPAIEVAFPNTKVRCPKSVYMVMGFTTSLPWTQIKQLKNTQKMGQIAIFMFAEYLGVFKELIAGPTHHWKHEAVLLTYKY